MFQENNNGVVWFLGCIAVLIFSGVLLSLLVDKRLAYSSRSGSIQRKVETDRTVLENLERSLQDESGRLEKLSSTAETNRLKLDSKHTVSKELAGEISSLRHRKEELVTAIPEAREKYEQYMSDYRQTTWSNAVGNEIERLVLVTGREYEKAVITRVTDFGLEISHAHGNARIDFKDLGSDYRDKFQWDDEGRRAVLERERNNRRVLAKTPAGGEAETPPEPAIIEPDPTKVTDDALNKLQAKVRGLKALNTTMEGSYADALAQSRYSNQRSVPGTLRTWKEQAALLEKDLTKARTQLALALEELRQLSPRDPLLRTNQP